MSVGRRRSTLPFSEALRSRAATAGRRSVTKARRDESRGTEAVAYYRVSTIKQVTEGMSLSEQQRQVLQEAARLRLNVVKEFRDEGLSGRRLDRAGFLEMIEYAETHPSTGHLVCMNPSRLGRNNWLSEFLIELSLTMGLKLHFVSCDYDLEKAAGRRDFRQACVEATYYAENASEESIRRGIQTRREGRPTSRPPNGFDPVRRSVSGPYTFRTNGMAGFIRRSFELTARGDSSAAEVLARMTEEGLRTKEGKPYSLQSFMSMLRNPRYAGLDHVTEDEWVRSGFTPIIDSALFDEVQRRIGGTSLGTCATRSASLALMGFARCATCGGAITGYAKSKNGKEYHYYKCDRDSSHLHASARVVEDSFTRILSRFGLNPGEMPRLRGILDEELEEEGHALRLEERRCRDQLSSMPNKLASLKEAVRHGRLDPEDFSEMKARHAEEEAELEEALRQAQSRLETFMDRIEVIFDPDLDHGAGWRKTTLEGRRMLQAALYPGGIEISLAGNGAVSVVPLPPGMTSLLTER